jgi:dienelactone hydrolase
MMRAVRLVLVNAAFLLCLGAGAAQAGRLIEFPNVSEQSKPAQLPGYLARPDAPGPFPAVVVLHGCSGFFSTYAAVADDLKWEGYVALAVDSLGPRGIANACGAGLIEQAG